MARNVGGREAILEDSKSYNIVLERKQRAVILEKKGDSSISEYIRECIDMRNSTEATTGDDQTANVILTLKEEILALKKENDQFRHEQQKRTKVNKEQREYLVDSYKKWAATTGANTQNSRYCWMQSQVKGLPISTEEALSYLQGEGLFTLERE